jgi:hypothetical protein
MNVPVCITASVVATTVVVVIASTSILRSANQRVAKTRDMPRKSAMKTIEMPKRKLVHGLDLEHSGSPRGDTCDSSRERS